MEICDIVSHMKVIKIDEVPKEFIDSPLFKGGKVSRQSIVSEDISPNFNMVMINFDKGAKNKWHIHDSDQVLLVTAGKGIVATEGEEREVEEGDIILVSAGEKHWHGATEESDFSHISLTASGSKLTQLEE